MIVTYLQSEKKIESTQWVNCVCEISSELSSSIWKRDTQHTNVNKK